MVGTIIALGGLSPTTNDDVLHRFIVNSAGKDRPKVCHIPAASGDHEPFIGFFYNQYPASVCEPSHLTLYRSVDRDPVEALEDQDVVYVGGGSTPILLAALKVHGLDVALRRAWERGAVLCGDSAGAHIWFEGSLTDSFGPPIRPFNDGLGFLPGCAVAHFDRPGRQDLIATALQDRSLPTPGWGIDDGAALVFREGDHVVVSSRPTGGAWYVDVSDSSVTHHELEVHRLGSR